MKKAKPSVSENNFSGSNEITLKALDELSEFVINNKITQEESFGDEINKFGRVLIKSQPNMVTLRKRISNIVYYTKRIIKTGKSIEDIKKQVLLKISETKTDSVEKVKKISELGSRLIFQNNKLLTISSSTLIKEVLLEAYKTGKDFEVYCLESRPVLEGQMLAEELSETGITTHLITDAAMAMFLPEVNFVFSGADRLYESGFVNKIGSYPLAMMANHHNVPFIIAAETDKILKEIDRSIRFYPQNEKEVYGGKTKNLNIHNYYFESVPYELIDKVVCEDGIFEIHEFIKWYIKD